MNNLITMAASSFSTAWSEFSTVWDSVWAFIWDNWYFAVIIAVPLGAGVISAIVSFIRSSR